jgi:hypothetical protein
VFCGRKVLEVPKIFAFLNVSKALIICRSLLQSQTVEPRIAKIFTDSIFLFVDILNFKMSQRSSNSAVKGRRWKDHFKSDFRSDQDHLLEK